MSAALHAFRHYGVCSCPLHHLRHSYTCHHRDDLHSGIFPQLHEFSGVSRTCRYRLYSFFHNDLRYFLCVGIEQHDIHAEGLVGQLFAFADFLPRLVRGTSYSENTDFNEQVLFPEIDTSSQDYDPNEYVAPRIYSTFGDLNRFSTNVEGALGYVDEDAKEEENEAEETKKVDVTKASKKQVELYFPAETDCSVTIKSATTESTGDIYISIGSSIVRVPWDRVSGLYTADVKAKREARTGTLTITGLFTSYDISLVGCEQYTGQDGASAEGTEEATEETTEETTATEAAN